MRLCIWVKFVYKNHSFKRAKVTKVTKSMSQTNATTLTVNPHHTSPGHNPNVNKQGEPYTRIIHLKKYDLLNGKYYKKREKDGSEIMTREVDQNLTRVITIAFQILPGKRNNVKYAACVFHRENKESWVKKRSTQTAVGRLLYRPLFVEYSSPINDDTYNTKLWEVLRRCVCKYGTGAKTRLSKTAIEKNKSASKAESKNASIESSVGSKHEHAIESGDNKSSEHDKSEQKDSKVDKLKKVFNINKRLSSHSGHHLNLQLPTSEHQTPVHG